MYPQFQAMNDQKRTILIIDDEEPIRKILGLHLTKEGYRVIQSSGGSEVFNLLRGNSYEVVISDIRMPGVDGVEILDFLTQKYDTVPVIMLTGVLDLSTAVDVMKKGAFDYITKPVRKEELIGTVERALSHRDLLERNKRLEKENREYQLFLEEKVRERTEELNRKNIELRRAYRQLKSVNMRFVNVLAETIEAKDKYTHGHCTRMRNLCVRLGRLVGFSKDELEILEYAALLHDLGKVSVNEALLNKNGALDEKESMRMREHSSIGERILNNIPFMEEVARIIGAHHENYDGSGYPRGLKGEEIPLAARIIAVVDVFDAMNNDRPYRKGLPMDVILDELRDVAGTQLDPELVRLFIENELYKG